VNDRPRHCTRPATVFALLGLLACEACAPSEPPEIPIIDRPAVVVDWCNERDGDACVLLEEVHHLDVWIDHPAGGRIEVAVDGQTAAAEIRGVDGGQHVRIAIDETTRAVEVRGLDPTWQQPLLLEITRASQVPEIAVALERAAAQDFAGAQRVLAEARGADTRETLELLRIRRELAWRAADTDAALVHATQEWELASASSKPMIAARAAGAACHIHYERAELARAEPWCRRLSEAAEHEPSLAATARYYDGLLAARAGDTHTSQGALEHAWRLASRVGNAELLAYVGGDWARVLAESGAVVDAQRVVEQLAVVADAPELSCTERALMRNNAAWTSITLAQAGLEGELPYGLLEAALADFAPGGACPSAYDADNVRVNLALSYLLDDEPQQAAEIIDGLLVAGDPGLAAWIDEVAAHVDVALGRWANVSELGPANTGDAALTWISTLRWAEQLERQGLNHAAIDAYASLEARLDDAVRSAGLAADHERLLTARAVSAVRLVELLVADGQIDLALCRARLAAARGVHVVDRRARASELTPDEREAWSTALREHSVLRASIERESVDDWLLPADQLERARLARADRMRDADARVDTLLGAPPTPRNCDDLIAPTAARPLLVAFPGDDATLLFVASGDSTRLVRAPGRPDAAVLGEHLRPALAALTDAERLTVVAAGDAAAIRFHALGSADDPITPELPFAYGLDLAPRRTPIESPRAALIFADPSGDLSAAEHEADVVEHSLVPRGWNVQIHRREAATLEALVVGLEGVTLFHYAGHGERAAKPWDAALRLHDGAALRVGDVLLLPIVPPRVVLAGCHTGARDPESLTGGLSLGRAFLLAGAEEVLVTDTEVPDTLTAAMTSALYELGAPEDLARALSRAQHRLAASGTAGGEAFRVLVR